MWRGGVLIVANSSNQSLRSMAANRNDARSITIRLTAAVHLRIPWIN
jgi:hypothetical protein